MEFPANLRYTKDHEWVRVEGEAVVVGITDYAQHALGDVVFVELPTVGDHFEKGKGAAVVESVKSVSDVYAPVCGDVVEINPKTAASPELLNRSPYGDGWMFRLKFDDRKEVDALLDAKAYSRLVGEQKAK
jgi:glycine cleavage system H protein